MGSATTRREFLETTTGLVIAFALPWRVLTAAAETWKVNRATCRAEQGVVIHVPTRRRLPYGSLAARAASLPVPTDVPLKDPKDFRLVGTRVKRLDTPGKVDGSAQFGIDVKVPGMLIASIERSPVLGGRVKHFNADRAKRSEEHTSELQSHSDLVCRLLLEKKKKNTAVKTQK